MNRQNRQWQNFHKRWNATRFEKFVILSLLAHGLLLLGVLIPAKSEATAKQQRDEELEQIEVKKQEIVEEAAKEEEDEIKSELKQEFAEQQLQEFYLELTEDYLDEYWQDYYWDELLEELDVELTELFDYFDQFDDLDALTAEQLGHVESTVEDLKAKMLEKLAEVFDRQQADKLLDELIAAAKKLADEMAANYRQQLQEKIGKPVGEELAKAAAKEQTDAAAQLTQAEAALTKATALAEKTATALDASAGKLQPKVKEQADAIAKKDKQADAQVKADVRGEKAIADAASADLYQAQLALKAAARALLTQSPQRAAELTETDSKIATPARVSAKLASVTANRGDAAETIKNIAASQEKTEQVRAVAQNALAAVRLQSAKDSANEIKRQIRASTDKANIAAAEKKLDGLQTKIASADEALEKADPRNGKLPGQVGEDVEQARAKLKEAQNELADDESVASGRKKIDEAAEALEEIVKQLTAAQPRVDAGEASVAEALTKQVAQLGREELPAAIGKRFEDEFRGKALKEVMKQVNAAVDRRFKAEGGVSEKTRKDIQGELEKILGAETLEKVKAQQQISQAADKVLPREESKPPKDEQDSQNPERLAQLTDATKKKVVALAERNLSLILRTRPPRTALAPLSEKKGDDGQGESRSLLKKRIGDLQEQLAMKRKDFLGQSNRTALAELHRKYQARRGAISKFRKNVPGRARHRPDGFDPEAYRAMIAKMKERGQISGQDFDLVGAEGDASVAETDVEKLVAAALVSIANAESAETTEKKPVDRKVKPPEFDTNKFAGVPFVANDAIKIDGDLTDWKDVPPMKVDTTRPALKDPSQLVEQTAYLAYCPQGLLLAVEVTDLTGKLENQRSLGEFWLNDAIEIYIDTLNTKHERRGETNTHQFFAFPFGHPASEPGIGGYEALAMNEGRRVRWQKPSAHSQKVMPRAGKQTDKGWNIELMISKEVLRKGEIKPGRIIGFNLQIDTGANVWYFWTSEPNLRPSLTPHTWGDVQFLGSDAKIELIEKEKDEPTKSVFPGKPVHVRVTDPDMNLDDSEQDKISVTLRTDCGDSETLILRETQPASGVFEGSLATRLSIGVRSTDTLDVYEGETVAIQYVDQARAFGERNQTVEEEFRISSFGKRLVRD